MLFQNEIIQWYKTNKRTLPWREITDAYVIWLSEIIMQQTRVAQGLPYFNAFVHRFPTVADFASASEEEVLKLWQGLGYYSRGRNMLTAAKQVMNAYEGKFPTRYIDLLKLKGVGEYTAAAISSFSVKESRAVVDGNVFRLLSRYFGIHAIIDSNTGKKEVQVLAQSLIAGYDASIYNQAIMEFGAVVCKPSPSCEVCPLATGCYALKHKLIRQLPARKPKLIKTIRYFNYFLCKKKDGLLMKRRPAGDIWQGLYDFPLIESDGGELTDEEIVKWLGEDVRIKLLETKRHLLTHQTIYIRFYEAEDYMINFKSDIEWQWINCSDSNLLPFPILISNFLEHYNSKTCLE